MGAETTFLCSVDVLKIELQLHVYTLFLFQNDRTRCSYFSWKICLERRKEVHKSWMSKNDIK